MYTLLLESTYVQSVRARTNIRKFISIEKHQGNILLFVNVLTKYEARAFIEIKLLNVL